MKKPMPRLAALLLALCLLLPLSVKAAANAQAAVKNRMDSLMTEEGFRPGDRYDERGQCRGFANKVYTALFNVPLIAGYSADNAAATVYHKSSVVGLERNLPKGAAGRVRKLFLLGKPGHFVQMGHRFKKGPDKAKPRPHTSIIYEVGADGVVFYEANMDGRNGIQKNFYYWRGLLARWNAFTIYAPDDYRLKE